MIELERMFRNLAGRDATAKELESLHRIKDTMRLTDNDAVWCVIILTFSQITSIRNVARQIERGAERYEKVIEDAGTKTASILDEARSELRIADGRGKRKYRYGCPDRFLACRLRHHRCHRLRSIPAWTFRRCQYGPGVQFRTCNQNLRRSGTEHLGLQAGEKRKRPKGTLYSP